MRLGRFAWQGQATYGVVEGDQIRSVSGDVFDDFEVGETLCRAGEVRFLPPVEPRSIVGVGINYPRRVEQHYSGSPQMEGSSEESVGGER